MRRLSALAGVGALPAQPGTIAMGRKRSSSIGATPRFGSLNGNQVYHKRNAAQDDA
jgi:hypothetical protein